MNEVSRQNARRRVERIDPFEEELAALEAEGTIALTPELRRRITARHRELREGTGITPGPGTAASVQRVSWGIRIGSVLGGAALVAALVLFLHRVWGRLDAVAQVLILMLAPLAPLVAAEWVARRAADRLFPALLAVAAGVMVVMGLQAQGAVLNLAPSVHALLVWGLFGLLVAHAYGLRLLLAAGVVMACAYLAALWTSALGAPWGAFGERPRFLIPGALVAYLLPSLAYRSDPFRFGLVYRMCGAAVGLGALLVESLTGHLCCGPVGPERAAALCQIAGLALSTAVVVHGIRLARGALVNLGSAFFVVFLYARLHAWWWNRIPQYLFFLLLAVCALGVVLVFWRLRRHLAGKERP